MKNILFLVLSLVSSVQALCQNIYLEYSYKSPAGIGFYRASIEETFSNYSYISEKQVFSGQHYGSNDNTFKNIFFKDKKANCLFFTGGNSGRYYYVKDSLHTMNWKFGKEKKVIMGFNCKSATTFFRGRHYIAFYTDKIPVSDGPYKFGGLPGLILRVISEDKEYEWNVEKIVQNHTEKTDKISIENILKTQKFITWQEHISKYKEEIDKMVAGLKAKKRDKASTAYFKIDDIEIIYPEAQTGLGIEY
ncbi:MAG: hypothetical protein OHK0045_17560 [Raineya sp.]